MKTGFYNRAADYGGMLNAVLCALHCAAGPLLLAWWGTRHPAATAERWEWVFLGLSGVLVALATRQPTSTKLRLALWGFFTLFTGAALGAEQWPALQLVQYAASAGLIGTHWLNQRHCRRCVAGTPPANARTIP